MDPRRELLYRKISHLAVIQVATICMAVLVLAIVLIVVIGHSNRLRSAIAERATELAELKRTTVQLEKSLEAVARDLEAWKQQVSETANAQTPETKDFGQASLDLAAKSARRRGDPQTHASVGLWLSRFESEDFQPESFTVDECLAIAELLIIASDAETAQAWLGTEPLTLPSRESRRLKLAATASFLLEDFAQGKLTALALTQLDASDADGWWILVENALLSGDSETALRACEALFRIDDSLAGAKLVELYLAANRPEEARQTLERIHDDIQDPAWIALRRGSIALQLGEYDRCMGEVTFLAEAQPPNLVALNLVAQAWLNKGNPRESLKACSRMEGVGVQTKEFYTLRATAELDSGQTELASATLKEALKKHPDAQHLWYLFGVTRNNLNDHLGAAEALAAATSLDADHAPAHLLLAQSLAILDNTAEATTALSLAVTIDSNLMDVVMTIPALKPLLQRTD